MEKLRKIVCSGIFSNIILFVVFLNSIVLGLLTSPSIEEKYGSVLQIIDEICLYIFVVEAALKIIALRLNYFKNGWNLFDFTIVVLSFAAATPAFSSFRVLRIIRVFRALKFISGVRNLQIIVSAIGHSIPSISWTGLLMLLIYYIFAVVGVMLFGESFPQFFGSLGKSMYSLFQVMTLESWSMGICRPVMAVYPYAWTYFVPFVVVSSFVILNIVVGIVVNSINEVSSKRETMLNGDKKSIQDEIDQIKKHLESLENMLK